MRDPVSGFTYPDDWVARCRNPEHLLQVEKGWAILTSSGAVLRRGYSTGTTAAAAAKAAILSLRQGTDSVEVSLPCGLTAEIPAEGRQGTGISCKDAGDYPSDITAGLRICAEASFRPDSITIVFGEGVGRFIRETPRYRKGSPAVSAPALACIVRAVQEALDIIGETGIEVRVTVPAGRVLGERTLNPKVGVEGGISILGTTGLVEPWDDHLVSSTMDRIAAAESPVLTTGRVGLRFSRLLFPDREVILIGGKIKDALDTLRGDGTLCGLPALILRHINPKILEGTGFCTVEELAASPEFPKIRNEALATFRNLRPNVTVVLINREGRIIGESP